MTSSGTCPGDPGSCCSPGTGSTTCRAAVRRQADRDREAEAHRLAKALDELIKKQNSILQQAADGDPDDPFTKALRGRYNELEHQRAGAASALADLKQASGATAAMPTAEDKCLVDALPYLALNLAKAPERLLRMLFEITQLTIRIDAGGDRATLEITLPEDQLPDITGAAERITEEMLSQGTPGGRPCEVAVRAPGAVPSRTQRLEKACELQFSGVVDVERRRRGGSS